MALYDTPSLANFRASQEAGIFSFNIETGSKIDTKSMIENPYVDNSTKDALKVQEFAASAVPRERESSSLIERAMAGEKPVISSVSTSDPLAKKISSPLIEKYNALKVIKDNPKETYFPFKEGVIDPRRDTSFDLKRFSQELADKESSGGDYKLASKVSSATGKYQFLWGTWANKIGKVTGVTSKGEFLNNPKAQEKFFEWYTHNEIMPQARKLQQEGANKGFTLMDIAKLIHFRGAKGTRDLLKWDSSKYKKRDSKNNMGIYEYLNKQGR